jgi:hypothetical protein
MQIDGREITSEVEIVRALQAEFIGETEFVVLDNGDDFIQTAAGSLEYRANVKNYKAIPEPIEKEKIQAAFLSYFRGDGQYLQDFTWEEIVYESIWTKLKKLFKK